MDDKPELHEWSVKVCRIGYGHTTINVMAANEDEAIGKADEEAGDHCFSEKSSEYSFPDGATQLTGPKVKETEMVVGEGEFTSTQPLQCPHCGSEEIITTIGYEDAGSIERKATCEDCRATWNEMFNFSCGTDLSTPSSE